MPLTMLLLLVASLSLAQDPATDSMPPSARQEAQEAPTRQESAELAVLRAQLELTQQYQQSLLQTVYFSLGSVLALAVILVGYNWYVGFRMSERDKSAVRAELRDFVRQHTDEKVAADLKKQGEESFKLAESTAESIVAGIQQKLTKLGVEVNDLHFSLLASDARYWLEQKGVQPNGFSCYTRQLEVALRIRHEDGQYHYVTPTLAKINELLDSGFRPDSDALSEIMPRAVSTILRQPGAVIYCSDSTVRMSAVD